MSIWPFKRREARVPVEAVRAKQLAEKHLEEARAKRPEVDRVTNGVARHLEENHIAEAIMASMAPRRRGRLRHP